MRLAVTISTYNEERTIGEIIRSIPKNIFYFIPSNFNKSLVENTLTLDCCLNSFSSDQIGELNANANAKYGLSLLCGDIFSALDRNPSYFNLGNVFISFFNSENINTNSNSLILANFITFSLSFSNSSKTKAGEISLQSWFNNSSITYLLTESNLKNENNILASIINNFGNDIFQRLCLLATLCFNSFPSLSACFSVNLLLDRTSLAIENSRLLTNFLTTLSKADSNLSFSLAGILTLTTTSAILSPNEYNKSEYLKLS